MKFPELIPVREDLLEGCEVILPEIGAELYNLDGAYGKVISAELPYVFVEITGFAKEQIAPIEDGLGFIVQVAPIMTVIAVVVIDDEEQSRLN